MAKKLTLLSLHEMPTLVVESPPYEGGEFITDIALEGNVAWLFQKQENTPRWESPFSEETLRDGTRIVVERTQNKGVFVWVGDGVPNNPLWHKVPMNPEDMVLRMPFTFQAT